MITFPIELVGKHLVSEGAVFFTEALAKINARQFVREQPDDSPCCAKCAGCELDEHAPLRDAKRLLEAKQASPASIVAYSMGKELAQGVPCRVVLIDGVRLAYQRDDGDVADPLSKFANPSRARAAADHHEEKEHGQEHTGCCCGQRDPDAVPELEDRGSRIE